MLKNIRRRVLAVLLGGLTFCAAIPSYAIGYAPTSSPTARPLESTLPNGLKVVFCEDHSFPVVSCFVWYHVGARNEPPGMTGISHVLEHMLFQNVGAYQQGALSRTLAMNGAQFNGYTSDDFTTFYELIHPSKLELAIKAEASRMRGGTFSAADLKSELGRVEQELVEDSQDSTAILTREVRATAFHQHPYGNPVTGWRCDLENLSAADVKSFYDRYYYPNNATLVLVGDFKADYAQQLVNKYFAAIPKSAVPPPAVRAVEAPQEGERRVLMKYSGKKEFAYIAYHAPKYSDPDAPATVVLEKILNTHFSGRIKSKLIETKTCSRAHSAFELKKDPGLFVASLTAGGGVPLTRVVDTWDAMISQLRSQAISDVELRRAKNQAEYALLNDRDGPYKIGFQLGFCDSLQSWQSTYDWMERLRSVSAADVERVAKRYLSPENRVVGLLSSTSLPAPKPAPQPSAAGKGPVAEQIPQGDAADRIARHEIRPAQLFGHAQAYCYKSADDSIVRTVNAAPYLVAQLDMDDVSQSALDTQFRAKTDADKAAQQKKVRPRTTRGAAGEPADGASDGASPDATINGTRQPADNSTPSSTGDSASQTTPAADTTPRPVDGSTPITATPQPVDGSTTPSTTPPPADGSTPTPTTPQSVDGSTAVSAQTSPAALNARVRTSLPVKECKLRNGMNLIVFESHLSPVVQIMGVVKAGAVFEPAAKQGVAELLTGCFNNGSTRISKAQLQSQQEDIGLPADAMLRFKCDSENISFHTRCLSRDLQKQLSVLNAIIRDPALSDSDLDHARQECTWLLKHADEALDRKVERAFYRSVLAPSSGFCPHDPGDLMKSVAQLKAADVKDYLMQAVAPESTTIVIAGDIDPDVAARLVELTFDGWTHSASYKGKSEPEAQPNPRRVLKSFIPVHDKSKNYLCLGKLVPINMKDQRYSYLLISDCALMSHPLIARLVQRFTQEPALAQVLNNEEIETRLTQMGSSTAWSISLPVEPSAVPRATNLMQNELRQFGRTGISAAELSEAKRYLTNALPVKQASNSQQVADTCLDAALAGANPNYLETEVDDIQNASVDAVNRFLHTEFKPEQATLVVAGDRQTSRDVHGVSLIDADAKHVASEAQNGAPKRVHEMH